MQDLDDILEAVQKRHPHEPLFHQAVEEVLRSVYPVIKSKRAYQDHNILERILEPERVFMFSVPWVDRDHQVQVNRGCRIQWSTVLGPSKGGLRFHPSVSFDILKFLAFEQTFKNALTGLLLGGGKGGSDFDPKGKTDFEVMSFCHAFMNKLYTHIGADVDVPAGDIGVGLREVGYLFGHYRILTNSFTGVFTGKGPEWGGSYIRPEATGYGLVYFVSDMLKTKNERLVGKRVLISGSGNVAQYAAEKVLEMGGKVLTMSDSNGFILDETGIDIAKLRWVMELKNVRRGRIKEYAEHFDVPYFEGKTPWQYIPCQVALPCAHEDEISPEDADALLANGVMAVAEGANMPSSAGAIEKFRKAHILFGPGKAANAGGVAVSGLEMMQNAGQDRWSRPEVDNRLRLIMGNIHTQCVKYGAESNSCVDYVDGANVAGFLRVANAMVEQGL